MKISDTPVFKTFFCKPPIPYFTTPTFLWEKSEHSRFKKFFRAQTSPPLIPPHPFIKGVPTMNYGSNIWGQSQIYMFII